MANKVFTDESLSTLISQIKTYTNNAIAGKANATHTHATTDITSGTLATDRLPTVPLAKGGTGATTAAAALTNLGITATAAELNKLDGVTATTTELNYVDGVTSNIQTQLNNKQDKLVSGTNIKTINNTTLIGSGNITISDTKVTVDPYTTNAEYPIVINPSVSGAPNTSTMGFKAGVTINPSTSTITASYFKGFIIGGLKSGTTIGTNATAEGYNTTASGTYSHAEGLITIASGKASHAEGDDTEASGVASHAEGESTTASANGSHAEGFYTTASGDYSHTEGDSTTASGDYSHTEGCGTIADSSYQHVQGKFNIEDSSGQYAHIVGNGEDDSSRSNAHTLDWSGNAWFAGKVRVGGTSWDNATELGSGGGITLTDLRGS